MSEDIKAELRELRQQLMEIQLVLAWIQGAISVKKCSTIKPSRELKEVE